MSNLVKLKMFKLLKYQKPKIKYIQLYSLKKLSVHSLKWRYLQLINWYKFSDSSIYHRR